MGIKMVRFLPRLRRQKTATPTSPPAQTAIAVGGELYFEGDNLPIRSSLERDFRALQGGSSGVSDGGLTKAVMRVVVMYVCVNWLGNQARSVPLVVLDRQGEPVEHSPFDWFLRNQAGDILDDCTKSLNVWGKAFLRKQRNEEKRPTGLEFVNPNNIKQDVDNDGRILGYSMIRTREKVPVADIIYIDLFSFTGDGNPHSPTEAAFVEAGIQSGQATYAVSFFFNQAVPAGMVNFDPPLQKPEYDVAKMEWRKNFKGAAKAHKMAILNGKATFTPFQVGMKDLAMDTLDNGSKQKICAAYGINPAVVGLGDVSSQLSATNTFDATKRASIEGAVIPMAQIIASALTQQWVAKDFWDIRGYTIQTNERIMPALSDVNSDRVGVTTQLVASNAWGLDEQREFLGQPPRENTDERLYWREDIAKANAAYGLGLISSHRWNQLTGLPFEGEPNMRTIDGKTISEISVPAFIIENALIPDEQPSFFSVKPMDKLPIIESPKLPPMPAAIKSDRRAVELDGMLSVEFGNHTLLKMARRQLAKMIPAELEAQWVADADWRLDVLLLSPCSSELVGSMVSEFDVQNRSHVELWASEFVREGDTVFLSTDLPAGFVSFRDSVMSHMQTDLDAAPEPIETMRIKLVTVTGLPEETELESIAAIPLTIDNLALVINDEVRFEWVIEQVTEEQRRELRAWQRKIKDAAKRGADRPEFHVESLPEHVAVYVREQLESGTRSLPDIWAEARKRLEARAIQATRLDYEDKVDGFIRAAVAENINRARMGVLMRGENRRFVQLAYRDGLIDGGVLDGVPTDDDKEIIDSLMRKANSFVSKFTKDVFSGKLSTAQLLLKPAQWYRGAINPAYTNGLLSADKNGMYECVRLRPSKNPCADCDRLEGQRHRLSAWNRRGLMMGSVGQKTICGGHECNHTLKKSKGRARGSW